MIGAHLTKGDAPTLRPSEQPLTRLAASAIEGKPGIDLEGYRDYRGSPSFGAWTWLDKYGIGVGTEVDSAEAERPGLIVTWAFWGLFGLLTASSAAIFGFTLIVARLQQKERQATLAAKKLGHMLEEKSAPAAWASSSRAACHVVPANRHQIARPRQNDRRRHRSSSAEVELTSQRTILNTISIYDFGRTPEGIFHYAMEHLDGLDLQKLVHSFGGAAGRAA